MSVIKFNLEVFAAIASTIKYFGNIRDHFLSLKEIGVLAQLKAYPLSEEALNRKILCWVERLYIANSLAFDYNCNSGAQEKIEVPRLSAKSLEGHLLGARGFLKQLRGIRYNLYTNAGHCFLGEEDMEKLERLIDYIRDMTEMKVAGFED
jgi:hypothetical protein